MNLSLTRASKFLSYVLRHKPDAIGLSLDAQGWAVIDDLVRLSRASAHPLSRALIAAVVRTSDKPRFRLSTDGARIRASQGHSLVVDLALAPRAPPAVLFHGTATRFLAAILTEGITAGARQHVHLSATYDAALAAGRRHGMPVVLAVRARAMHHAGRTFYRADNGVWLTDSVPVAFVRRLSGPPAGAAWPVAAAESRRVPRRVIRARSLPVESCLPPDLAVVLGAEPRLLPPRATFGLRIPRDGWYDAKFIAFSRSVSNRPALWPRWSADALGEDGLAARGTRPH